jgi:hypothetical protein
MNQVAKTSGNLSIISVGWDAGLFSLNRLLGHIALPQGKDYTFRGKGVSQGHSDAIRRVDGVENWIQYTVPVEESLEKVRNGSNPEFTSSILVAYARAIAKLANQGKTGACTVLDIPYTYLSPKSPAELRKELL